MKIIDKQNKKYTRPEDFEAGDFFYDEIGERHYWIVANNESNISWKFSLIRLETQNVIDKDDNVKRLIYGVLSDTSCLVKINSDQVTMSFDRDEEY